MSDCSPQLHCCWCLGVVCHGQCVISVSGLKTNYILNGLQISCVQSAADLHRPTIKNSFLLLFYVNSLADLRRCWGNYTLSLLCDDGAVYTLDTGVSAPVSIYFYPLLPGFCPFYSVFLNARIKTSIICPKSRTDRSASGPEHRPPVSSRHCGQWALFCLYPDIQSCLLSGATGKYSYGETEL